MRKSYDTAFKVKVAIEAAKEQETLQIVGKAIRERNRETAIKGDISRKRSTDRGS